MGTARVAAVANDQRASLLSGGYATGRLLISEEDLQARIRALGREITTDYAGRAPLDDRDARWSLAMAATLAVPM